MNIKGLWKRIPAWGQAFLIALLLLLFVHFFLFKWVAVRSTSMYGTLLPGDLLGVQRWPVWSGLHRGDILVFHDPVQDDRPMRQRQLLVKRIAGVPGDEVALRDGRLHVNGQPLPAPPGLTTRWAVRVKEQADVPAMLRRIGLPADYVLPGQTVFDLPLNEHLVAALKADPHVAGLLPARSPTRMKGYLFPHGPNYRWNNDNYGPLPVPAEGDTVDVNAYTLPLYDRIISRYEHNDLAVAGRELLINGTPLEHYVIGQDYYFVLGDSRDNSSDSRYWGFVPADHVVGRAGLVLLNADGLERPLGHGRWFIGL